MLKFLEPSREMPKIRVFEGKKIVLDLLKQICNECLIKFSENQSAPKLENRKTSPCSPCAPNLLHVLVSRIPGYHNLCSPVETWYRGSGHMPEELCQVSPKSHYVSLALHSDPSPFREPKCRFLFNLLIYIIFFYFYIIFYFCSIDSLFYSFDSLFSSIN